MAKLDPDDPIEIGKRLRWLRTHLNLDMREFSELLGVKRERYYNWEVGRQRLPLPGAKKIWADYGLSFDFIYLGVSSSLAPEMFKSWAAFQRDAEIK